MNSYVTSTFSLSRVPGLFQFRFEGDRVEVTVRETAHDEGAQFVGQLQEP